MFWANDIGATKGERKGLDYRLRNSANTVAAVRMALRGFIDTVTDDEFEQLRRPEFAFILPQLESITSYLLTTRPDAGQF